MSAGIGLLGGWLLDTTRRAEWMEEEKHLPGEHITRLAVMATVLLSIFAHGLSASPGIRLHSQWVGGRDDESIPRQKVGP